MTYIHSGTAELAPTGTAASHTAGGLKSLLGAISTAAILVDNQGVLVQYNIAAAEWLASQNDSHLGRFGMLGLFGNSPPQETEASHVANLVRRALTGETLQDIALEYDRKSGAKYRASWTFLPQYSVTGSITHVLILVQDAEGENTGGDPKQLVNSDLAMEIEAKAPQHFEDMVNAIPQMIWTAQPNGTIDFCNTIMANFISDCLLPGMVGADDHQAESVIHPDDIVAVRQQWEKALKTGADVNINYRLRDPDGSDQLFMVRVTPLHHSDGGVRKWVGSATNIQCLSDTRQQLERSQGRYRHMVEHAMDGFMMHDEHGKFIEANQLACDALGYSVEEISQMYIWDVSVNYSQSMVMEALSTFMVGQTITIRDRHRRKDGSTFPVEIKSSCFEIAGQKLFLDVARDMSENDATKEKLNFLSFHDPLTGLPNRTLIKDRFDQAKTYADRTHSKIAIISLDLDSFKSVNEALGHVIGDALLRQVAKRLSENVRPGDAVSRQGGDEFTLMLADVYTSEDIISASANIGDCLVRPFFIDQHELPTSASMGVAVYPDDGKDFDTLFKQADTAMYYAKQEGRNTFRFFNPDMAADSDARLYLIKDLRQAEVHGELFLHYQPQIDLNTGAIIGAEALVRWRHPEMGMLPPALFIPIAEDTGQIVSIGAWVLKEACRQAVIWRNAGLLITIAVNLSAVQFKHGDLEQTIINTLAETGLDPAALELELTESILIGDTERVLQTVRRLKAMRINFSIDDFGTGYSSLAYLRRFEVDKLKIDKSFISKMAENSDDAAIALTIIQLAHSLKLRTVAEGVEDINVLNFLRALNCDEAQGYYFSKPLDPKAFESYIANTVPSMAQWMEGAPNFAGSRPVIHAPALVFPQVYKVLEKAPSDALL